MISLNYDVERDNLSKIIDESYNNTQT